MLANFNQIWLKTLGLSTLIPYHLFENRQLGEEKERGSITCFIEEKVEARGNFHKKKKKNTSKNTHGQSINIPGVQKAPGRTLTFLNTRKSKYKV